MRRLWPPSNWSFFLILALIEQVSACVDVLFVIDNRTLEISRSRALQVAKQLPEDQKIRKWVVLSREDRYVPRVLRNNAELQSVLSTIHGDYDRFLEIATGEISRRTSSFQPFVILLFSDTPVNQTMTNMWRKMSLAPALHIFRIGNYQKRQMLSEDQEMDFEKLILCGHNKTNPFGSESSKFSGGNEIRRAPTSTHRPLTSTRDPFVRRLTFYDASRTLLEEKPIKKTSSSPVNNKYTITRTFRKMTTKQMSTTSTTTARPRSTTSKRPTSSSKFDAKKYQTTRIIYRTTQRPESTVRWTPTSSFPSTTARPKLESSLWHPTAVATTSVPPPAATMDFPPEKLETVEVEEFRGKNFKVRSRSVHFAMTEKPPVSSTMNMMRLFSTTRPSTASQKPRVPYVCTADVFFLVDLSQGTGDKSQQYLDIAASAISNLPISQEAVRVGLISYSGPGRTQVRVHLDKHNDKEKLIEEMFLMERHGGTTRTADAIRYATKVFEGMAHPARRNVKKVLVVFTDGYSQDNPKEAARVARAKGLQMIAVAVKDKLAPPDEGQLGDIGGHKNNVFVSPNGKELREKILGTQCRL